ncbi:MAG: V-type ATPase subunit [Deltaproteobacteria bacterium]|nr:V-type ATPase subunit [Deltaproteobacteria bacterium]
MDLGYFNARIKGFKGRLLRWPEYEVLFSQTDMDSLVERLRATDYRKEIEVASAIFKEGTALVSEALRMNMLQTFGAVWSVCPEAGRPYLNALFSIWEVFNLKTLVRGIDKGGVGREGLMDMLMPVAGLDRSALRELNRSRDMAELIRTLATWGSPYAVVLKNKLRGYLKNKNTYAMEMSLDQEGFKVLDGLPRREPDWSAVRGFFSMRADAVNIMTLVKTSGEGFSPQEIAGFFIDGGKALTKKSFLAAAKKNTRDEVLMALADTVMGVRLRHMLFSVDRPGLFEKALDTWMAKEMLRFSIAEPLCIALVFAYVYMKVREIKNLRLILRAKAFGIPSDELKDMLAV